MESSPASSTLCSKFQLHYLIWDNNYRELDKHLNQDKSNLELFDPRGRTPLHLAVTLGHLESAKVLLRHGANVNTENKNYWTVLQEAVSTSDPELVQLCLQYREHQQVAKRNEGVPKALRLLKETPDFYVEMKWEFTSWIPLVSRVCPSDTYKIFKSGANVRIDTTLLGFDNMNWQRGDRSYIFKGDSDSATMIEIDHDLKQVFSETMSVIQQNLDPSQLRPSEEAVALRLTSPVITNYVDIDKISFERNKSGIWGWRNDRVENVNSYECKVFSASNVELVAKTRTEHLTEKDKARSKKTEKNPLETFLSITEQQETSTSNSLESTTQRNNPCSITKEQYFDSSYNLKNTDIGRPTEISTKIQKFKANLWLCESYPLTLQDQIMPIINLMAAHNAHFKKLKDFIQIQLPSGFPVKIEIPLFHVLNARITFGNIHASDTAVSGVTNINESGRPICVVGSTCFDPPDNYDVPDYLRQSRLQDENDELLRFAIEQSLLESGTESEEVTFWEALSKGNEATQTKPTKEKKVSSPPPYFGADHELQRALEESMMKTANGSVPSTLSSDEPSPASDNDLTKAIELSQKEMDQSQLREQQEEDELQKILKLSLVEY